MVVQANAEAPRNLGELTRHAKVAAARPWIARRMIVRQDHSASSAPDRSKNDAPLVELDAVGAACGKNLVVDQAAARIEEQHDQRLLGAKADQPFEESRNVTLAQDPAPLAQLVIQRMGHDAAHLRHGRRGFLSDEIGHQGLVRAEHRGQGRKAFAQPARACHGAGDPRRAEIGFQSGTIIPRAVRRRYVQVPTASSATIGHDQMVTRNA